MSKPIILMADDDRDILTTNKILLSDSFEIEIASSVEEAKEKARKYSIVINNPVFIIF